MEQKNIEVKQPAAPVWLSLVTLAGGMVQGVCAILVASSSLKILLGVAALAGAIRASVWHAPYVRIPLMFVSTALALFTLYLLWNAYRLRNLHSAQWRKRSLTLKEKASIAFSLLVALLTLILVVGELFEHPL